MKLPWFTLIHNNEIQIIMEQLLDSAVVFIRYCITVAGGRSRY